MNPEMIMRSDVLDIVFENRNKIYGAYDLRKFYNKRMLIAIAVMLAMALILCSFTLIRPEKIIEAETLIVRPGSIPGPDKEVKKEPEKKHSEVSAGKKASQAFSNNIKIVTDTTIATKLADTLSNAALGTETMGNPDDSGGNGHFHVGSGPGNGGGGGSGEDSLTTTEQFPVDNPDIAPQFPGGMKALRKFLEDNLVNPMEIDDEKTVRIRFVVGYDGKLQSFEIVQDGGEEFNDEVIRVLKMMPDWTPGKNNGKTVPAYHLIPVKFVP